MSQQQITYLSNWMKETAESLQYGHVTLTLKVHGGEVTLVEKNVRETEQTTQPSKFRELIWNKKPLNALWNLAQTSTFTDFVRNAGRKKIVQKNIGGSWIT